ncbi:MAG: hypothetical protein NXI04_16630 [Planctomycetaceae bacterium]|nr:hypothetical protein [Planctomycetaceae bacterium]
MEDYKPVSTAAVISIVLAAVSVVSFLTPIGLCLTLPSLVCAVGALWSGSRHPAAGRRLAICSLGICTWLLINVPVTFYVAYKAESPAGYARLDFAEISERRLLPAHVGRLVCFKGFPVMSTWSSTPVTEMVLSPDGSRRDTQYAIAVQLEQGTSWTLYGEPLAVSGILVENVNFADGEPEYIFQQAVIRKSQTPFGIAPPAGEGC